MPGIWLSFMKMSEKSKMEIINFKAIQKSSKTDILVIGAGSVVTKDISQPGIYAGNPVRKIRSL